jgi:hypothetical protein
MTPDEQERIVGELEIALDRLQALYNQYFMGIEKIEPTVQRKDVERKIHLLRKEQIRNTAIRFRMQTQIQKYNTQSTYWRRICRQIEEGTYKRDVMRAQRRTKVRDDRDMASKALAGLDDTSRRELEQPPTHEVDVDSLGLDDPFNEGPTAVHEMQGVIAALDDPFADPATSVSAPPPTAGPSAEAPVPDKSFATDPDKTPVPIAGSGVHNLREKLIEDTKRKTEAEPEELSDFFARRSIPPPPPKKRTKLKTKRAAAARAPASKAGLSEDRTKAIYRAYVSARKKSGENADVSFKKISNLLRNQMAANKSVKDFKVVIRNGKAVIKTVKK